MFENNLVKRGLWTPLRYFIAIMNLCSKFWIVVLACGAKLIGFSSARCVRDMTMPGGSFHPLSHRRHVDGLCMM